MTKKITSDEYYKLVEKLNNLINNEFDKNLNSKDNIDEYFVDRIVYLISLVNTIAYLRGDNNFFIQNREINSDDQEKFYKFENELNNKLREKIQIILESNLKEYYLKKIKTYYCD